MTSPDIPAAAIHLGPDSTSEDIRRRIRQRAGIEGDNPSQLTQWLTAAYNLGDLDGRAAERDHIRDGSTRYVFRDGTVGYVVPIALLGGDDA